MDKRIAPEIRIGIAIRAMRLEKDWSQEELSARSKLHRTYIGAVERGEKNLTLKALGKIARALAVKSSDIMVRAGL